MNGTLGGFQDDFIAALYGRKTEDALVAPLVQQPGFAIYRNTVIKGCIDALAANFPCVARLVGSAWFHDAAAIYVRRSPPTDARLLTYGDTFADFIGDFVLAGQLPYLAGVARLDRLWIETHVAADEPGLDPTVLAGLTPAELANVVLHPRAAVRWIWFDSQPVYTIWRTNREGFGVPDIQTWSGEGALLLRMLGGVAWRSLNAGGCAFLGACAAGLPLGEAATRALEVEPATNLAALLSDLLTAGVFGSASPINPAVQNA